MNPETDNNITEPALQPQAVIYNAPPDNPQEPLSPNSGKSKLRIWWFAPCIIFLFAALLFQIRYDPFGLEGFSPSSLAAARAEVTSETDQTLQNIGSFNAAIQHKQDDGCDVRPIVYFGSIHSSFVCTYSSYVFITGSGNKKKDLEGIYNKILAAGFEPSSKESIEGYAADEKAYGYSMAQGQNGILLSVFDNNFQLSNYRIHNYPNNLFSSYDFNKGYLVGFSLQDRYFRGRCIICQTAVLTSAKPMGAEPTSKTTFDRFKPTYIPSNYEFKKKSKNTVDNSEDYLYVQKGTQGNRPDERFTISEFPIPSYYDPPKQCGNSYPSGSLAPCELLMTTAGGDKVYTNVLHYNIDYSNIFVQKKHTLIVINVATANVDNTILERIIDSLQLDN